MASSTSITICGHETIRKVNDAVYELYRPARGSIDLEIIFFHGFQSQDCQNAYVKTWMRADESACWLNSWLSEKFPQSRIVSVSYDSSTVVTDSTGKMDMYVVGENLAKSMIELAKIGQTCPVVLVGHCVGGLVLKEVCRRAEQLRTKLKAQGHAMNSYDAFLSNMRGAFFYSTSQLGFLEQGDSKIGSPLMKYYELLSKDAVRLNEDFSELRKRPQYSWKTWGVIGANGIKRSKIVCQNLINLLFGRKLQSLLAVEEAAARHDMDEFCVLRGEDHASICKPKDQNSSSFEFIVKFVQIIYENEELAMQWRTTVEFPAVYISMPGRVQEVITLLRLDEPEPSTLYLVGMGGIGKSTLAKEVMVKIRSQFDVFCFVNDVKSRLTQDNLHDLIAAELFHGNGLKVRGRNGDKPTLWQVLRGKKVLLIMDNVDSEEHIGTLLRPDWIGRGSRLIITSRERPRKVAQSSKVHEVPFLSREESKMLFLAHLDVETGRRIRGKLIDDVVAKCDGLPLTLEVTGSSLSSERNEDIWSETLWRLTKGESIDGNVDDWLWAKLKVSFERLAPGEKRMFLDLAMFDKWGPNGLRYDLHIWRAVWNEGVNGSSPEICLRNLQNKFFIRREHNMILRNQANESKLHGLASSEYPIFVFIHEQLRDMGRNLCRQSHERIELCGRVLQIKDVDDLRAEKKRVITYQIETLWDQFATSRATDPRRRSIGQSLRLLRMSYIGLIGEGTQRFPSDITLLHMNTCWRAKVEGYSISLESACWPIRAEDVGGIHRMRVLILEKCLNVRLPSNFDKLRELRILMISGEQLRKFPKKFGFPPCLQVLILEGVGLTRIPNCFYPLSSLQNFTLKDCRALPFLPPLTGPRKSMLTNLVLEDLPSLENLPEAFDMLGSLTSLSINGCSSLSSLPENFGKLGSLRSLKMNGCSSLSSLPENFGKLGSLMNLKMNGCSALVSLPENFGKLSSLWFLEMNGCSSLSSLPENFGQLGSLRFLMMNGCSSLSLFPENFGQLGSLRSLIMNGCSSFSSFPENFGQLGSLRSLIMNGCSSLSSFPENFGQLGSLKILAMNGCSSFSSFPENFGQSGSLKTLVMNGCSSLSSFLENFGQFGSLKILEMNGCSSLSSVPENFGQLGSLEILERNGCSSLSSFPENFGQLGSLKILERILTILVL